MEQGRRIILNTPAAHQISSKVSALELTREELEQADTYEPAEYKRKLVQLKSGLSAWVYLTNSE